jgi:HNH endonuclease
MNPNYAFVAGRAAHRCEYCQAPEVIFNFLFEVEHIVPLAREGMTDMFNLALSCRSCNAYKGTQTNGLDTESNINVSLFNPRQEEWAQHFRVDAVTGEILDVTEVGRVTVTCLRMNSDVQLEARKQWIRLGIFL